MSVGALICRLRGVAVEVGRPPEAFRLEAPAFDVLRGDRIALVSPSGSGKSLFLELLGLARAPERAERFSLADGAGGLVDVVRLWEPRQAGALSRQRRGAIGFLLQTGGLLPFLRVAENLALPARLAGRDPRQADALLEALGLGKLARRYPRELSGGEKQRVALARAAAARPTLLLADEPTAALDPRNADRVMRILRGLPRAGLVGAVVIATHDEARARAHGFTIVGMQARIDKTVSVGLVEPRALAA